MNFPLFNLLTAKTTDKQKTVIERDWGYDEDGEPLLKGFKVYRYYTYHNKNIQSLEITSTGYRQLLAEFETLGEAKAYYPKAPIT